MLEERGSATSYMALVLPVLFALWAPPALAQTPAGYVLDPLDRLVFIQSEIDGFINAPNKQVSGDTFCSSGGYLYVLKNPAVLTDGPKEGYLSGEYIASVSSPNGGADPLGFSEIQAAAGDGRYFLLTNNALGCNILESEQGSAYTFVEINGSSTSFYNFDIGEFDFETGINSTQNTRFLTATLSATGTLNRDVLVSVSYFLDPAEINRNVSAFNPTQVRLSIAERPGSTFARYSYPIPLTTGTGTARMILTDANLVPNGTYDLLIQFSNSGVPFGNDIPFENSYVYTSFQVTGSVLTNTGGIENYNSLTPVDTAYATCSLASLGGCFTNAGVYLYTPSDEAIQNFENSHASLFTRAPFVYVEQLPQIISALYPDSTVQFSLGLTTALGAVTFLSTQSMEAIPYRAQLRDLMAATLWVSFALLAYRRVMGIHSTNAV